MNAAIREMRGFIILRGFGDSFLASLILSKYPGSLGIIFACHDSSDPGKE
jgi:hypothetical protein